MKATLCAPAKTTFGVVYNTLNFKHVILTSNNLSCCSGPTCLCPKHHNSQRSNIITCMQLVWRCSEWNYSTVTSYASFYLKTVCQQFSLV